MQLGHLTHLHLFPILTAVALSLPFVGLGADLTNPPPTFVSVVNQSFRLWDSNGDGQLSPEEIDAAIVNPAFHDEAAAAIAAIKLVVRGGKYTLPPITQAYLVGSPLREKGAGNDLTNNVTELLDSSNPPKPAGHPPAFQPRYRNLLTRLHKISRDLFPQTLPALDACHQGPLGDCYLISVIGGMVARDPAAVAGMFQQHKDGVTTVTFGNHHRVEVPPLTDAEIAISSSAGTNGLWLTILENAYGKDRGAARFTADAETPDTDAIAHGGSCGFVINQLDGFKTKLYSLQLKPGLHHTAQFPTNLMVDLKLALQSHLLAAAATPTNALPPGINGKHAYASLAYQTNTDIVHLWNPHGNNFKPKGPDGLKNGYTTKAGQFDIPLTDLLAIYRGVTIETATPNRP